MDAAEIKQTFFDAIEFAIDQDLDTAKGEPSYAQNAERREAKRARNLIIYLSTALADANPDLQQAFSEFLDRDALAADAAKAREKNRQVAGSEHFSHPAPGAGR